MIRRPPRSTLSSSSAASDVYKRQFLHYILAISGQVFSLRPPVRYREHLLKLYLLSSDIFQLIWRHYSPGSLLYQFLIFGSCFLPLITLTYYCPLPVDCLCWPSTGQDGWSSRLVHYRHRLLIHRVRAPVDERPIWMLRPESGIILPGKRETWLYWKVL